MSEQTFIIRFPEQDNATANVNSRELADFLRDEVSGSHRLQIEQRRANPESQDFGATLVLVLGTAAATAVAKGIQAWLKGHTGVTMEIATNKGYVIVKNVESKNAADIAKAFTSSSI